jgi:hypothetical protein
LWGSKSWLQPAFEAAFSPGDLKYRRQPITDIVAPYPKTKHAIQRLDCQAR